MKDEPTKSDPEDVSDTNDTTDDSLSPPTEIPGLRETWEARHQAEQAETDQSDLDKEEK
ncbi:MAG: hypothetical protein OXG09_02285 [Chloroflexi bacterium]|nr:hypothetical protein [Chloroflexota bacterium]